MKYIIPWISLGKIATIVIAICKYFNWLSITSTWMELFLFYCLLTAFQKIKEFEEK